MFKQAKFSYVQRIQTKAMLVWWWLCYNLYLVGLTTYDQGCLSRRKFGFGSVSSVEIWNCMILKKCQSAKKNNL